MVTRRKRTRRAAPAFPIEQLVEVSFAQRLETWLDDARSRLHLTAIAIAELAADQGRVAPAWRHGSPRKAAPAPLPLDVFERLVQGLATRIASSEELQALGAAFQSCPAVTILVLTVKPSLSTHPDTLLVAMHERAEALAAEPLAAFKLSLEQGLSVDRRRRMAEVVFHAVEQAADPIELTDREARLIYANAAWEQTFGYVAREVVGQTVGRLFRDPVAPVHDSAFYQFTLATLAEGRPWSGALACRTRDGSRVLCEPMVSPFAANEQGFTGNFAVRRNLAQRAQRDAALAVAHHEFRAVLSAVPDGVAVLREGRIYFANAAFLNMAGRSEQSVIGLAYLDLVFPDDRAEFLDAHQKRVTGVRIVREDGPPRFAEISTAGAVSFEGKPAMILLSRDVTEHRIAQEQLARADKLSALGSLAAGVAHEINNPLAYVLLNLIHLRELVPLREETWDSLADAIDGAKRIQQIVSELRGYSGTDAPSPPAPVDVSKAITSAINIAHNEIRHRARLERKLEPKLFVLAREGQLVQVLVNLLVNAAQAIPASGSKTSTIGVRSESSPGGGVTIEVSDTGVGIAPSQLPHVFEAFSTTKPRAVGSGLGLSISKRMIEDLGGRISIRSTFGLGTVARIELPKPSAPAGLSDAPLAARDDRRSSAAHTIRLLIVDDEITIASTLQRMLPQYDIAIAADAADALQLLSTGVRFDVVLCDLMMPGMSGPELYREVCRLYPKLSSRFVFMTGGAFADAVREFLERARHPVLTKPFNIIAACRIVEQVAGQHNGARVASVSKVLEEGRAQSRSTTS